MKIHTDMTCCKPMREGVGLACEPGWLLGCLARACAKMPTLEERRRFADQVTHIKLLADPQMQASFRAEVVRCYEQRKRAA